MADFDRFGDTYERDLDEVVRFSGQDADFFSRVKARRLLSLVGRHVGNPRDLSALDVGCGIGLTDTKLAPGFGRLAGIDISPVSIEHAAARNRDVDYRTYDGNTLPYADGTFDVVFTICVLHHVPPLERVAFVSEMQRVLRDGGIAVIGEHNPLNPLTRLVVSRCAFDKDVELLRAHQAETLLRAASLEPVDRRYILIAPTDGPLAKRIENSLSSLPFGAQYLVAGKPNRVGASDDGG